MPCSLSSALTSTSHLLWVFSSPFGPREKKEKNGPIGGFFYNNNNIRRWVQGKEKESGTASGID